MDGKGARPARPPSRDGGAGGGLGGGAGAKAPALATPRGSIGSTVEALLAASLTTAVMIPQPGKGRKQDKQDEKKVVKKPARSPSPSYQYCTSFVSAPRPQSAARDFEEQQTAGKDEDAGKDAGKDCTIDSTKDTRQQHGEGSSKDALKDTSAAAHPSAPNTALPTDPAATVAESGAPAVVAPAPTAAGDASDLLKDNSRGMPKGERRSSPIRDAGSTMEQAKLAEKTTTMSSPNTLGMHTGPGWSYASAARSREYPAHPLEVDVDADLPVGADAASLAKCTFLASGPAPLEYPGRTSPTRHTFVPTGPVQPGVPKSPTWCLSCPPNSLGFSTAWAVKKDVPEPKVRGALV